MSYLQDNRIFGLYMLIPRVGLSQVLMVSISIFLLQFNEFYLGGHQTGPRHEIMWSSKVFFYKLIVSFVVWNISPSCSNQRSSTSTSYNSVSNHGSIPLTLILYYEWLQFWRNTDQWFPIAPTKKWLFEDVWTCVSTLACWLFSHQMW